MLKKFVNFAAAAAFALAAPALAQVQTIDPNQAGQYQAQPGFEVAPEGQDEIQPELQSGMQPAEPGGEWAPVEEPAGDSWSADPASGGDTWSADPAPAGDTAAAPATTTAAADATTVPREDVFSAAEGLFGRGAEGLAGILEDILRDQGEPSAYISGQEAGGAFVFGVRYGSGTMHHQVEGDRAVYWTGPSLGFDFGADANKVFVLVYNLHDSQELFKRYPGGEGHAYFVGGFSAQYLRRGDVVLIPVRLGAGLRLGINAGYMRFSERNRWVPF